MAACPIIREGKNDAAVTGWAGDVLIAAGRPKGNKRCAQAIVDAFRRQTVYRADAVGAERIASAAATLCLRPGLCVRVRDCDDGLVAVGSALMSIGIPVQIVTQRFRGAPQPHVLLVFQDDDGKTWIYCDPGGSEATSDPVSGLKVGEAFRADEEEWIDPMNAIPTLGVGQWQPQLVGYGGVGFAGLPANDYTPERAMRIASSASRIVGAAGWDPVIGSTAVKAGDVVRGSFNFDKVDTAMYSGAAPIDYLRGVMPGLFGKDADWAVWLPGEQLPPDWMTDDSAPGTEWHFRSLYRGATPATIPDFGSSISGLRLWVSRGDVTPVTPPSKLPDVPGVTEPEKSNAPTYIALGIVAATGVALAVHAYKQGWLSLGGGRKVATAHR